MRRVLLFVSAIFFTTISAFSQSVKFNIIPLGQNYGSVAGDFNGDGREDLIASTGDGQTNTAFHLLLSNATGDYSASTSHPVPTGLYIYELVTGDFNGDGKLDLAIIVAQSKAFYIYFGDGHGGLQSPVTHSVGFVPVGMVAADVNHDGKMDLVLVNHDSNDTILATYLGDGGGGFSAGPTSPFDYAYNLYSGDFDGDGKADVMNVNCDPGGCNFNVYYGDGAGHFGSPTQNGMGQTNFSVADVDGDGKTDIIGSTMKYINGSDRQFLTVFYGQPDRTLLMAQIPTSQCTFDRPIVADFNGDHLPDIVFAQHDCSDSGTSAQMAFLAGQGNRTFGSEQVVFNTTGEAQPASYNAVMRANNSDTKPDFIFTQRVNNTPTATLMVNESSGTFAGCNAPNSATGFRICAPAGGATVPSPVKFSIGAAGGVPMRKVEVWADGTKKVENLYGFSHYAFLDANVSLSPGTHSITLVSAGWDNSIQSKTYSINVQGTGGGCSTGNTITVCSPSANSTVSSPVHVVASTTLGSPTYRFELWDGGTKLLTVRDGNNMDTSVALSRGQHRLAFVARKADGTRKELDVNVTVQ